MPFLYQNPRVTGLPGERLYFYRTGTSAPQNVYTDIDLDVAHAVPVEADIAGVFDPIYLDPTLPNYRVVRKTSADVTIETIDDVPSNQNVQQSTRLESTNPFVFLYDTDGTSGSRKYRIRAAGAAFEIQAGDESESSFSTILRHEGGVLYSNATEVAVTSSGSFTGSLSGMSEPSVSGTFNWRKVNNIVYLWIVSGITGTSDENGMTMSSASMPAGIIPASSKVCPCYVTDAGNAEMAALALMDTGGVLRFDIAKTNLVANYVQYSQSGFTASGTKGIAGGWLISYPLL